MSGDDSDLPWIGNPARRALEAAGVTRLAELAAWTERDVLALHGVGPKTIRLLREPMAAAGISFAAA